jgi:hypothetical protein
MESTHELSLFTWAFAEPKTSRTQVSPICPKHPHTKTRWGTFGTGIIVICEAGNHLVGMCERPEFEAELTQAREVLMRGKGAGAGQ